MLPDKYGIHEKTVKKPTAVIGRFLCFAYTIISASSLHVLCHIDISGLKFWFRVRDWTLKIEDIVSFQIFDANAFHYIYTGHRTDIR